MVHRNQSVWTKIKQIVIRISFTTREAILKISGLNFFNNVLLNFVHSAISQKSKRKQAQTEKQR